MFFSVLFGFFLARVEMPYRQTVLEFWQGVFRVMMRMTLWVMSLAPVGIFGLTARVVAKSGVHAAGPILTFGACVVGGIFIYAVIAVPLLVRARRRAQSVPPVFGDESGVTHSILHRVVRGGAAVESRMPGKARGRIRANRKFRDAARHVDQSRRQRAL